MLELNTETPGIVRKTIHSPGLKLIVPRPLSEEVIQIVRGAIQKYEEATILLDNGY